MGRSKSLDIDQQRVIAEYAINHPEDSDALVAARYGCTVSQVRYAKSKVASGELHVRRDHIADHLKASAIQQTSDPIELLDSQIHTILAQLEANTEMKATDRAAVLRTVTQTKRVAQGIRLERHMKTFDATLICALIRRFLPDASDEECITIYHEEVARCRAANSRTS